MKHLFTVCFLVWEAWLRIRGPWRRWVRARQRGDH